MCKCCPTKENLIEDRRAKKKKLVFRGSCDEKKKKGTVKVIMSDTQL